MTAKIFELGHKQPRRRPPGEILNTAGVYHCLTDNIRPCGVALSLRARPQGRRARARCDATAQSMKALLALLLLIASITACLGALEGRALRAGAARVQMLAAVPHP